MNIRVPAVREIIRNRSFLRIAKLPSASLIPRTGFQGNGPRPPTCHPRSACWLSRNFRLARHPFKKGMVEKDQLFMRRTTDAISDMLLHVQTSKRQSQ
jgi:hypothetical protein